MAGFHRTVRLPCCHEPCLACPKHRSSPPAARVHMLPPLPLHDARAPDRRRRPTERVGNAMTPSRARAATFSRAGRIHGRAPRRDGSRSAAALSAKGVCFARGRRRHRRRRRRDDDDDRDDRTDHPHDAREAGSDEDVDPEILVIFNETLPGPNKPYVNLGWHPADNLARLARAGRALAAGVLGRRGGRPPDEQPRYRRSGARSARRAAARPGRPAARRVADATSPKRRSPCAVSGAQPPAAAAAATQRVSIDVGDVPSRAGSPCERGRLTSQLRKFFGQAAVNCRRRSSVSSARARRLGRSARVELGNASLPRTAAARATSFASAASRRSARTPPCTSSRGSARTMMCAECAEAGRLIQARACSARRRSRPRPPPARARAPPHRAKAAAQSAAPRSTRARRRAPAPRRRRRRT